MLFYVHKSLYKTSKSIETNEIFCKISERCLMKSSTENYTIHIVKTTLYTLLTLLGQAYRTRLLFLSTIKNMKNYLSSMSKNIDTPSKILENYLKMVNEKQSLQKKYNIHIINP